MKIGKYEINDYVVYSAGGLILAGAIFGGWYWYSQSSKTKSKSSSTSSSDSSSSSSSSSGGFQCTSSSYPLTFGTCHPDVKVLQKALKNSGSNVYLGSSGTNGDGVDGQFGNLTKTAARLILGKTSFTKEDIDNLKA